MLDLNSIVTSYESGDKTWNSTMYNLAKTEIARIQKIVGPEIHNDLSNLGNTNSVTTNTITNSTNTSK